jgi:hypothetical protein
MNKAYLYCYLRFLFLIAPAPVFCFLFLYQSGEYVNLNTVVEKQINQSGKTIYGSSLHSSNVPLYKINLMNATHPKVIALGSSRVLQFRQHMFLDSFVNLGRVMNSINEGVYFAKDIAAEKTKIILLGADFWWFNENSQSSSKKYISNVNQSYHPKLSDVVNVLQWLFNGKISVPEMLKITKSDLHNSIGLRGAYKDGFGPDGSYYYTRIITGQIFNSDQRFKDTFERIKEGNRRLEYSKEASKQHIENFVNLVENLKGSGSHVIIFFPPFAPTVNNRLHQMGEKYAYFNDLKTKLAENKIRYFDYTDVLPIGSSDCEFIDGFHGGEVTYARILLDISQKDARLKKFVDSKSIIRSINRFDKKAFITDKDITHKDEVDFLNLGCKK